MLLTEGEVKTKISHHTLKNDSNRRYKGTTFGEARGGDLVERGGKSRCETVEKPCPRVFSL